MRRDAASAAAGGGVQRLQFGDDFLQLGAEVRVSAGAQLGAQMFQAVDGDGFPGLKKMKPERNLDWIGHKSDMWALA